MEWALFTDLVLGKEGERRNEVSVHVLQGNVSVWQAGHQFVMLRGRLHLCMLYTFRSSFSQRYNLGFDWFMIRFLTSDFDGEVCGDL